MEIVLRMYDMVMGNGNSGMEMEIEEIMEIEILYE